MENIRKHLPFGSSGKQGAGESRSKFHRALPVSEGMSEYKQALTDYTDAIQRTCGAGTHLAEKLLLMLKDTPYAEIAGQFLDMSGMLDLAVKDRVASVTADMEALLLQLVQDTREASLSDTESKEEGPDRNQKEQQVLADTLVVLLGLQCWLGSYVKQLLAPFDNVTCLDDLHKCGNLIDVEQEEKTGKQDLLGDSCKEETAVPSSGKTMAMLIPTPVSSTAVTVMPMNTPDTDGDSDKQVIDVTSSPGGIRKQISKATSFFSNKLSHRTAGSGESPSQSSFYVDLLDGMKEAGSGEVSGPGPLGPVGTLPSKTEDTKGSSRASPIGATLLSGVHIPASAKSGQQALGLNGNWQGQVLTQEELDTVIDLLSGWHRPPMQVIPENLPPPPLQHPPPQPHHQGKGILDLSNILGNQSAMIGNTAGSIGDHSYYGNLNQRQRRSDSLHTLGDAFSSFGGGTDTRTNTWPSKLQHRASFPTEQSGHSPQWFATMDNATKDYEYWRYLNTVKHMRHGGNTNQNNALLAQQTPWATTAADGKLNRSWPTQTFYDSGEAAGQHWSTAQDSSSNCSDESSNGETPWTLGLDLMQGAGERRRHSSGGDSLPSSATLSSGTENRHRSVEDLFMDSKSTNTWPPKQPWSRPQSAATNQEPDMVSGDASPASLLHPPLSMQWSDPIVNRTLPNWGNPPGVTGAMSHQNLQTNYGSAMGASNSDPKMDHKFSYNS